MIGESGDVINFLYDLGTRIADAGGKQPMSCSNGFSGSPISNVIFSNICGRFVKSLNMGPISIVRWRKRVVRR